jgi:hypothetical protein
LVDFLRGPRTDKGDINSYKDKKKNGGDKENFLDLQKGFPFKKELSRTL